MVVSLALILSSSNLYGYIRCKLGGNFKTLATQYLGKQIFYNVNLGFINYNNISNNNFKFFSWSHHLI